jgi:ring-1,2-phenylacetyl-CoA epoxidase subunit PaaD
MGLRDFFRRYASRDHAAPVFEAGGDKGRVLEALRGVDDPEMQLSIVDLGLVRELHIEGGAARVVMTLTTRGCPLVGVIQSQVEDAVRGAGFAPEVEMVFDPPWSPEDMSEAGRAALARR